MSDRAIYTGLRTNHVHIEPRSIVTLDLHESNPNFYKIFNNSDCVILCATSKYPTPSGYDFKVNPHKIKGYADIFQRSRLYLYNTSTTAAEVVVHSFAGEFDPAAYFMADWEFDVSALSVDAVITGFEGALPTGNNQIGYVSLNTTQFNRIEALLSSIDSKLTDAEGVAY